MEKIELYNKAKDAYYNGVEIMSDLEFDNLEKELGLENKGYIGSKTEYTVKHPLIMGSLSKIQLKYDNDTKSIKFDNYYNELLKYVSNEKVIITPKYDGCSFEAIIDNGKIESISTRGDGNYGKDIYNKIINKIPKSLLRNSELKYIVRGEVLCNKSIFENKYKNDYSSTRSFVSSVLNSKNNDDRRNDLSIVIYDYRVYNFSEGVYKDNEWIYLKEYCNNVTPEYYTVCTINSANMLETLYNEFTYFRNNCKFDLDGIVIKKVNRLNNLTKARPIDCVAIKFPPTIKETKVTDIIWNIGKNNELYPIINFEPIILNDKKVTKCSGYNFGYINNNKINIGSILEISLSGDIIPFLYNIKQNSECAAQPPVEFNIDGIHAYKIGDNTESSFMQSIKVLRIPSIGEKLSKEIYNKLSNKVSNILLMNIVEFNDITKTLKNGKKIYNNFMSFISNDITIADIIRSCGFNNVGKSKSEIFAKNIKLANNIRWYDDDQSFTEYMSFKVQQVYTNIKSYIKNDIFVIEKNNNDCIKVVLTGKPNNYKTKKDFLQANPNYSEVSSISEANMLFTNDINSNSNKMKQAKKLKISINEY